MAKIRTAKLPTKPKKEEVKEKVETRGAKKFWTEEKVQIEADFLIETARDSDVLSLLEIYSMRDYGYKQVSEWDKEYEFFRKSKEKAKQIIGARREKGALLGELNQHIVSKSMGLYDPDFKSHEIDMKKSTLEEVAQALIINGVRGLKDDSTGS